MSLEAIIMMLLSKSMMFVFNEKEVFCLGECRVVI